MKAVETEDKLIVKVAVTKTPDLKTSGEKERVESKILKLLEPKILKKINNSKRIKRGLNFWADILKILA